MKKREAAGLHISSEAQPQPHPRLEWPGHCKSMHLVSQFNSGMILKERKKERNPLQKGEAEDIIGPCGV